MWDAPQTNSSKLDLPFDFHHICVIKVTIKIYPRIFTSNYFVIATFAVR